MRGTVLLTTGAEREARTALGVAVTGWGYAADVLLDSNARLRALAGGVRATLLATLRLMLPTDSTSGSMLGLRLSADRLVGSAQGRLYGDNDSLRGTHGFTAAQWVLRAGLVWSGQEPARRPVNGADTPLPIPPRRDIRAMLGVLWTRHPLTGEMVPGIEIALTMLLTPTE